MKLLLPFWGIEKHDFRTLLKEVTEVYFTSSNSILQCKRFKTSDFEHPSRSLVENGTSGRLVVKIKIINEHFSQSSYKEIIY